MGYTIGFDVLAIVPKHKLGETEGYYIRKFRPALNIQIPKKNNWHSYEFRPIDEEAFLNIYKNGAG